jgi:choline dehydrogenase-like flavoprotein
MVSKITQPEYDVIIVGSGVAGALIANQLAQKQVRVLLLEAGGVAEESLDRYELLNNYAGSASKATDAPFCGDNVLATQPDPRNTTATDTNYYFYPPGYQGDPFKSFYERIVGGSTWHWQGIYVRMLPTDFTMNSTYQINSTHKIKDSVVDWPIRYEDVEPYYVRAEREMGVAGSRGDYEKPRFRNPMSRPYPMRELAPSYLDKEVGEAVNDEMLDARIEGAPALLGREPISIRVTPVPHAINSEYRDGRPACEGRSSCVPLCAIKARYEAVFHVEKALRAGAILRKQAVVTTLQLDDAGKRALGVHYRNWIWQEKPDTKDGTGKKEDTGKRIHVSDGYATGRIIVLAANAIENPMILLRSKAAPSSGAVLGAYLMDHPIKQSFGLAKNPLYPYRGPQTTSHIEGFRDGKFRKAYAAFKTSLKNDGWSSTVVSWPRGSTFPIDPDGDWLPGSIVRLVGNLGYTGAKLRDYLGQHALHQITLNSACEQLPIIDNKVSLASVVDDLDLQRPQISYGVFENDGGYVQRSFQKIIEFHGRVFDLLGVPKDRRVMLDKDKLKVFLGSGHIMGTTRMGGKDDRTKAVVDPECRSFDHPNLFVVGSSVFPTSSTANPTSTVAALALRAADSIEKQLRTGT